MPRTLRLTCVVVAAAVVLRAAPRPSLDDVGSRMQALVGDGKAPSIVAAVGRDGRIVWRAAHGHADKARAVAATPTTPYSLASVSKPFTATAVMMLSERGLVGLDEPVSRYVTPLDRPGVTAPGEVTVRRTLGHVAGFPVHYQFFFRDRPAAPLPFARTLTCYGVQVQRPGDRYIYSNLGYGVLGELVTRTSDLPYAAFLARDLFEPLGLAQARVATDDTAVAGSAVRYGLDGQALPFYNTDHAGASDVFASAEDMVRFGLFHAGALEPARPVLTAASRRSMQQPGAGGYGFGWNVNRDWRGRTVVWHSGAMPGVAATLWVVPEERVAIAVLANQFGAPVNQLAGELLASLLGVDPPDGGGAPATNEGPAGPRPRAPAVDLRGRWRGSLQSCPEATDLALDVRGVSEMRAALGGHRDAAVQSASSSPNRLTGTVAVDEAGERRTYRFDLRLHEDRLEGPVVRTTSLGPRGSSAVTFLATLRREVTR